MAYTTACVVAIILLSALMIAMHRFSIVTTACLVMLAACAVLRRSQRLSCSPRQ